MPQPLPPPPAFTEAALPPAANGRLYCGDNRDVMQWLARRGDLRKLHESCDYCLNDSMLAQLPVIIKQHLTA